MNSNPKKLVKLLGGVCLVALLAGCADDESPYYTPLSSMKAEPAPVQMMKYAYHIGPGDELEIKFFFAPELNDKITVRPDGKISMMFAQDVQAAGLTPDELGANLRKVLAPHVKQRDLVVIVRNFASQKAYVGGEVAKPGLVPLTGDESLLQVLSTAGWVTPAGSETIVVIRRDATGFEKIYPVDIAKLESGEDLTQDVHVQAGDMILVPPSDIVISDRWIDQNIRQLLPFSVSTGMFYNINSRPNQ